MNTQAENTPERLLLERLLLSPKRTAQLLDVSQTTIWRLGRDDPSFPRPIRIGPNRRGYRMDELLAWLEGQPRIAKPAPAAATAEA